MIDFHSHVLPGVDDGAGSVKESVALLHMLSQQGVDRLALTPHFYAQSDAPDRFFKRRTESFEKLRAAVLPTFPEIKLGAEVFYFPGISRMEQLREFCLEGTRLLLLEMPTAAWRETMINEIMEMHRTRGVSVVLAHVERYAEFRNRDLIERLLERGISLQINAESFLSFKTRGRVKKMLLKGEIRFIGSDCHDMRFRPPQMGEAFEYMRNKLGDGFLERFEKQNLSDWEAKNLN